MRDTLTNVIFRVTFTSTILLSTITAFAAVPAEPSLLELLTIQHGKVFASRSDGAKRELMANSRLLRTHTVTRLFDWKDLVSNNSRRLLVNVQASPATDEVDETGGRDHAHAGGELWQIDTNGSEKRVAVDVFRATLSPNGEKVLYATGLPSVVVRTNDGQILMEVSGYDPSWKPDGTSIVLSTARDHDLPRSLRISTIDLATGNVRHLTEGTFDDHRPEFDPSGRWVLFVSGVRSGIASFWRVSTNGGDATQLTNVGATVIDDRFVPTPFERTLWSSNGRWFLYDFKVGDQEEVWGLQFATSGDFVRAVKLAVGLNPQWVDDGISVGIQSMVDGELKLTVVELPR
jgi:hypothetical protein